MANVPLDKMAEAMKAAWGKTVSRAEANLRVAVKLHMPRAIQQTITESPRPPVDRGAYRRSFQVADIPGGARVYNPLLYAAIIEFGRRPGARMPPVNVIADWVRRKRIVKGRGKDYEAEVQGMAFVIARAIKQRGLPARHILGKAARRAGPWIHRELMRRMAKGV